MIRLILISLFILSPNSSQAITWEEFWRPFTTEYKYYPRRIYSICRKEIYREEYIPGDRWNPGYVRRWTEVQEIPC